MAQSSEIKLLKRFDQNVEITGTLTVGGATVITSIPTYNLQDVTDNGATTTNDIIIDGHLSILDTHSLYMFAENDGKINIDARGSGTGAMLYKWNRNALDTLYLPYYENWYDGNSYHELGVESDTWRIGTRSGTSVLYVGDLDASTNGALDANKQGIVIQGTGGRLDNPQDGTERLPVLQFFDSVTNYGSNTATAGELRGGVEWYTSETSSNFPAISGAIYSVNENTYNTQMGLAFYTNYNGSSPTEKLRIGGAGEVNIVSGNLQIGGTTVIDSGRAASFQTLQVAGNSNLSGTVTIDTGSNSTDALVIRGAAPTISFIDDDTVGSDDFYIHVNSNNFYVLRDTAGADIVGTGWDSPHPLQLEGDTNIGYLFGSRMFADNYHPNADKWTSARTITLGGDLTGSVSIDGSSNVTLSAQVVNDSHTHDGRYYTEEESEKITARALGWVPAYSNTDESTVFWNETEQAVQLYSGSDTQIGMSYKAVRMKAGDKVRITVMVRSAFAASTGLYLRPYFLNGNLPNGKTHVSHNASSSSTYVQEDSSGDTGWYENGAIGTAWQNFERTYTAPADGYMSLVILNWTGIGTGAIYVKQPDIQFEKVNDANNFDGLNSTQFLRSDADDEATGFIVFDNNSGIRVESGGSTPDTTTGTYQQGVTITGGNQRLNIDVSDVTNGGAYLQTRHSSSTYPNAYYDLDLNPLGGDVTLGAGTVRVKGSNGYVGIGVNPEQKLHVEGGNAFIDGNLYVANTNTASNAFYVMRTGSSSQSLRIHVTDDAAVFTSIQDENSGAFGSFVFNLDSGATDPLFDVRYGSSTIARFRANDDSYLGISSNVGIGTTTPDSRLDVTASGANGIVLNRDLADAANSSRLFFLSSSGNIGLFANGGRLDFRTGSVPNSTSGNRKMTLTQAGDLLIGTGTSPENKVHIEHDTNSDLLLEIDNQNTGSASTAGILLRGQGNNFFLRNLGDGTSLPNSTEFKSTAGGGNFRFNLGGNEVVRMTGTGVPLQVNHINSNPTLFIGRASGIASIKGGASGDGHLILDSSNNSHAVWCQHYTSGNVYLATGGGNVGINTTTLNEKLTVAGGISLTGNLEFGSSNGYVNLSRGSFITFYEGGNPHHGIGSRNNAGSEADDIRINSYGAVYINLDSNNNNSSGADFIIGRHGGATGSIVNNRFKVDGETGAGTFAGDVIAFGSPSDISLKENIKPIEGALDKVKKLQGVTFDWKQNDDDILKIKEDYGFIAQEVQEVLPELVRENENGKLSLRDKGIISVLVEAIKELSNKVEDLENKLNGTK